MRSVISLVRGRLSGRADSILRAISLRPQSTTRQRCRRLISRRGRRDASGNGFLTWAFCRTGCLVEPGGEIRRHGEGAPAEENAANGRQHGPHPPVRVQPVRHVRLVRAGWSPPPPPTFRRTETSTNRLLSDRSRCSSKRPSWRPPRQREEAPTLERRPWPLPPRSRRRPSTASPVPASCHQRKVRLLVLLLSFSLSLSFFLRSLSLLSSLDGARFSRAERSLQAAR